MTPDGKKQDTPATPVKPRPWFTPQHTAADDRDYYPERVCRSDDVRRSLSTVNGVSRLTKRPRPLRGAPGMTMDSRQGDEARLNRGWGLR